MPQTAVLKKEDRKIYIWDFDNPKAEITPGSIYCGLCGVDMVVVDGNYVSAHFRHKAGCSSDYESKSESMEHRFAKWEIYNGLFDEYMGLRGLPRDVEVRVPESKRIADVLFTYPDGGRLAVEVQLSPISTDDLFARITDYEKAGVSSAWVFSAKASTERNINLAWSMGCRVFEGFFLTDPLRIRVTVFTPTFRPLLKKITSLADSVIWPQIREKRALQDNREYEHEINSGLADTTPF